MNQAAESVLAFVAGSRYSPEIAPGECRRLGSLDRMPQSLSLALFPTSEGCLDIADQRRLGARFRIHHANSLRRKAAQLHSTSHEQGSRPAAYRQGLRRAIGPTPIALAPTLAASSGKIPRPENISRTAGGRPCKRGQDAAARSPYLRGRSSYLTACVNRRLYLASGWRKQRGDGAGPSLRDRPRREPGKYGLFDKARPRCRSTRFVYRGHSGTSGRSCVLAIESLWVNPSPFNCDTLIWKR